MILFSNIEEFRIALIDSGCLSYPKIASKINLILGDLTPLDEFSKKIAHYIDPKEKFNIKVDINSPLPERLSDEDYRYIKKCFKRANKLVDESNSLRIESPADPRFYENVLGAMNFNITFFVFSVMLPSINRIYLQDVNKIRAVIPSALSKQLEAYQRSILPWSDFNSKSWEVLKFDTSSVDRFVKSNKSVDDVVEKFVKDREEFTKRYNQYVVNDRSISTVDADYILVGWWDLISERFESEECVIEYRQKIESIELRKLDICFIIATYLKRIKKQETIEDLMKKSPEYLLEFFWSHVVDIKKKILRENSVSTPTYVINVFWSMFTEKIEE